MHFVRVLQTSGLALMLVVAFSLQAAAQDRQPSAELENLRTLSRDFYQSGAYVEALMFARQAFDKTVEEFGETSEQAAIWSYGAGLTAEKAGDHAAAVELFGASVRAREVVYGRDSATAAQAMERQAEAYLRQGDTAAAKPLFVRVLKIRRETMGGDHPFTATAHAYVAAADLADGRAMAALEGFRRAATLIGQEDLQVFTKKVRAAQMGRKRFAFVGLAAAAMAVGRAGTDDAGELFEEGFTAAQLAWRTSAASAIAKMAARLGAGNTPLASRVREVDAIAERLEAARKEDMRLLTEWSEKQRQDAAYSAALAEFRDLSIARNRDAQPFRARQMALTQEITAFVARCPPGQDKPGCEGSLEKLNTMTRELTELSAKANAGNDPAKLMAVHGRMEQLEAKIPGYQDFKDNRARVLAEQQQLDAQLTVLRANVAASYPEYQALVDPKPLPTARVRELVSADEAVVLLLSGRDRSYVFAITRDRTAWSEITAPEQQIAADVTELRQALDPLIAQKLGREVPFDVARAHKLYRTVFGGIEDALLGKSHIIFVPTGPMTSLPPQVLVTRPPRDGATPDDALADAAWLLRRSAISVLPSVQSLEALRTLTPASGAARAFIGIGDPVLKGPGAPSGAATDGQNRGSQVASAAASRPARPTPKPNFYRGNLANVRAVSALVPLPDTADELRAIAGVLGAGPDEVLLQDRANETLIKRTDLKQYRVIQFATHGLVTGELSGLAEPALVLTPPNEPSELNDGLLTASEIVTLSLDADWVVLSACNTAAGEDVGAEALSGLARAFFFAGARAMLVSHWSVISDAAVKLTTTAFSEIKASTAAGRPLGRAEALRRSMLALIDKGRPPAYWAPFVVVGDGGRS